jgi:hypothetical protein
MKHLNESPEENRYRQPYEAYLICKSPNRSFYKSMGLRKNNFFMNCYIQKAHPTNFDIFFFSACMNDLKTFSKDHILIRK